MSAFYVSILRAHIPNDVVRDRVEELLLDSIMKIPNINDLLVAAVETTMKEELERTLSAVGKKAGGAE